MANLARLRGFVQDMTRLVERHGANIGAVRRHVYDPVSGAPKDFVSGYHNRTLPNLWDRSSAG